MKRQKNKRRRTSMSLCRDMVTESSYVLRYNYIDRGTGKNDDLEFHFIGYLLQRTCILNPHADGTARRNCHHTHVVCFGHQDSETGK